MTVAAALRVADRVACLKPVGAEDGSSFVVVRPTDKL